MSEQPYGKILRGFWTDPEVRALPRDARFLLLYYFSSPRGSTAGIYHAPPAVVAADTGLPVNRVRNLLTRRLASWITYDPATDEVFVHNGARHHLARLAHRDNRRRFLERALAQVHSHQLVDAFLLRYAEWGISMPNNHLQRSPQGHPKVTQGHPKVTSLRERESERERTTPIATQSGQARVDNSHDLTEADLMGLIRQHLYVPNGKEPKDWNAGRDIKIIRALRRKGLTGYQLGDAIEGLALMRDAGELDWCPRGEKLTMRGLFNTRHGVRPLLYQAQEAAYAHNAKRPDRVAGPFGRSAAEDDIKRDHARSKHIGEVLDRMKLPGTS